MRGERGDNLLQVVTNWRMRHGDCAYLVFLDKSENLYLPAEIPGIPSSKPCLKRRVMYKLRGGKWCEPPHFPPQGGAEGV